MLSLFSITVLSQDFGEGYEKYLELKTFDKEPDADILVIFDKGKVNITRDFDLEFEQHVRIKILTEEGKSFANVKLSYWHEDDIYNIEAASYNTDGKVYELDDDNIFDEGSEKFKIKSLAIPGVEVGSVIEYKYKLVSDYITSISPWYFQSEHYTLLSEYSVAIPAGFVFNKVDVNIRENYIPANGKYVVESDDLIDHAKVYTWTCVNLPGIKDEPYVDNLSDQYARIQIIFESYNKGMNHITFAKTWKSIAERLNRGYSNLLDDNLDLPSELEKIVESTSPTETKVKEIYNYIASNITTGKHKGIYASSLSDLEDVLENKTGSAVEKNMLLINLYRRLDLKANPVLISTRSHGAIIPAFVNHAQFNRIICLLELNKKKFFLAANQYNPFGYLIPNYNVSSGFKITDDNGEIIKLAPKQFKNSTTINTKGELTGDGVLNLVSTITNKGYSAYNVRNNIEDEDLSEWMKSLVEEIYETAEVDTFFIENKSMYDPITITIHYNISDYIEESDDLIYFAPPLFSNITENVFVRETREFPINFNYSKNIYEKCKITLPKNVTITEIPGRKKLAIKNYTYAKKISAGTNYVQILKMSNRKARTFSPEEYQKLRILFEKMLEYDTEQLVLNKSENTGK